MAFAPLLSATADPMKDPDVFGKVSFPVIASPKLDGIRCIVRNGRCVSRKLIDLPSAQVQSMFSGLEHFDGEIIVGNVTDFDVYNRTQSFVMSGNKRADEVFFYVFDWANELAAEAPFTVRLFELTRAVNYHNNPNVILVPQREIKSLDELMAFEEEMLSLGYEGIMWRKPSGPYKHGRSTFKEQTLVKLKRFQDDEAVVTGFIEERTNTNAATKDELGHTKRSSNAEGMVGANTLGKFIVKFGDLELEIPCGVLKHPERKHIWDHREAFVGQTLKFRHFPHGAKDLPRLPRFVGWRTAEDM